MCVRPSGASLFFPISFHYHAFLWGRFGASRLIMPVVALRAFGDNSVQFVISRDVAIDETELN